MNGDLVFKRIKFKNRDDNIYGNSPNEEKYNEYEEDRKIN